jgi:hypothetical protein
MGVTIGYPELPSHPMDITIRQIKGTMVRRPTTEAPAPNAFGIVHMIGGVFKTKLHRKPEKDKKKLKGKTTVSAMVKLIARDAGYATNKIFVQETLADGSPEPVIDEITIPDHESYMAWVYQMAEERGFECITGDKEFHWHSETWETGREHVISYFKGPDLLDFSVDGDFRSNTKKVRGYGINPKLRKLVMYDAARDQTGLAYRKRSVQKVLKRPAINPEEVVTAIAPKVRERAIKRITARARAKWKLKLVLVGNPKIWRGTTLSLENFGPIIDGRWNVRGVRHKWDSTGYTTTLELRGYKGKGDKKGKMRPVLMLHPDGGRVGLAFRWDGSLAELERRNKKSKRKKHRGPTPYPSTASPLTYAGRRTKGKHSTRSK